MKKILIGCILAVSAVSYSATDVMSTLEQLELNLQQLEAEERAMYNQRKAEAEEAERTLAAQRKMYAEISEKEKRILGVKDNKFYKAQYQELAKKYGAAKKELESDMAKQQEIINIFEAIKQVSDFMEKNNKNKEETYRLFGCRFNEKDFKYIIRKLNKLKKEYDISNSVILLELFKKYNKKN